MKDKGVTRVEVICAALILGEMNEQARTAQLHVLHLMGDTTSKMSKGVAFLALQACRRHPQHRCS